MFLIWSSRRFASPLRWGRTERESFQTLLVDARKRRSAQGAGEGSLVVKEEISDGGAGRMAAHPAG